MSILPFGKGKGSSDFLFLEVSEGGGQLGFEVEEDVEDLLGNIITGLLLLGEAGGELEELGHGIVLEDMSELSELIGNGCGGNLDEGGGGSGEVPTEVVFQKVDDVEGISVVLEGFNEEGIGVASLFSECLGFSLHLYEASFSPNLPGLDVLNLGGNAIGVSLSLNEDGLVHVGNGGEGLNGSSSDLF